MFFFGHVSEEIFEYSVTFQKIFEFSVTFQKNLEFKIVVSRIMSLLLLTMAKVGILEEVSRALMRNDDDDDFLRKLFSKISCSIFENRFLKEGDHVSLLNEGKQGFSRCFDAEWCIPKQYSGDFVPLR